jgi:hypothetical protein
MGKTSEPKGSSEATTTGALSELTVAVMLASGTTHAGGAVLFVHATRERVAEATVVSGSTSTGSPVVGLGLSVRRGAAIVASDTLFARSKIVSPQYERVVVARAGLLSPERVQPRMAVREKGVVSMKEIC